MVFKAGCHQSRHHWRTESEGLKSPLHAPPLVFLFSRSLSPEPALSSGWPPGFSSLICIPERLENQSGVPSCTNYHFKTWEADEEYIKKGTPSVTTLYGPLVSGGFCFHLWTSSRTVILYRDSEKFFRLRSSFFSPSRVSSAESGTPHELVAINVLTDYFLTIAQCVFSLVPDRLWIQYLLLRKSSSWGKSAWDLQKPRSSLHSHTHLDDKILFKLRSFFFLPLF